jgi:hypothetical protein
MNWKKLSEEKPPVGAYIMIDTGDYAYTGWVRGEDPAGFEYWCYIERHDGSVYAPVDPYAEGITLEGYRIP